MKIKLNDGAELEAICVNGKSVFMQGLNRDSLEFVFKKGDYLFEELDTIFSDSEKTKKISIKDTTSDVDADGNPTEVVTEYVYDDYSLKVSMKMEPVVITPATTTEQEVTEERVMITLAQLTLIEKKLMELGISL